MEVQPLPPHFDEGTGVEGVAQSEEGGYDPLKWLAREDGKDIQRKERVQKLDKGK